MEPSSEVKRSTHVTTVQPNETVLTAFPYGPHSSLLNFLKGDPKVLGAIQVLLALVTVGIGTIFAFNYFNFSQRFPLVFLTGYPFWGAFIFIITGYLTGLNVKRKCLKQSVMAMNVISSLVAIAGITFTIISYRYQHQYCQVPSLEGICVIGRILFNGILSVLLIISIVELSISVTITSFRSKCWTKSNEIVFFLPSDVTQDSELSVPEETAVIKFEIQEESSNDDSPTHIQPVFFGGYTFFKFKVSRHPLTFQCSGKRGRNNYYKSLSVTNEQQKGIPPPLKLYEEDIKPKPLPATQKKRASKDITHTEKMNDEDLQFAMEQPPEMQTQFLQAEALPLQVFPSHSVKRLEALPPQDLPSQDVQSQDIPLQGTPFQDTLSQDLPSQALSTQTLPVQALLSETPTSHVIQSCDLVSEDMPSQDRPSKNIPSQDMLSKTTPSQDMPSQDMLYQGQVLPIEDMLFEAQTSHAVQSLNVQHLEQPSLDLQLQNVQHEDEQIIPIVYQDIQSEVNLLTEEWKSEEKLQCRKSIKRHFLDEHSIGWQSPKRKSLDLSIQGHQSPKRKSLDLPTQGQQSPKRKSLVLPVQGHQSPKRKSLDLPTQGQQSPKRKSLDLPTQGQQSPKRKSLDLPTQGQQSPKRKSLDQPIQGQESPRRKSLDQYIKAWLFPKRCSIDKQVQVQQTTQQPPDQKVEGQLAQEEQPLKKQSQNGQGENQQGKEEQSPKEQPKDKQDEDQQGNQEKSPEEQTQHQQAEDLPVQKEKSPMQLGQHWQSQIQGWQDRQSPREQSPYLKIQDLPSLGQQSQDWRIQDWRNEDYKARECQFGMLHSLNWGSQAWQTQDLSEREYLKQKALYQEAQTVHDLVQCHCGWQLPSVLFQDGQQQEKDQKNLRPTCFQKEALQTKDIKLGDMKSLYSSPSDQQSEDVKPDFYRSFCQSSVQDLYFTYLPNADSSAQQNSSICSSSHKEDLTLSSFYAKDRQQSEDSD